MKIRKKIFGYLFTKEDQKTIDSGGMVIREAVIEGNVHRIEMTKRKFIEKVNGVPTVIVGELIGGF